MARDFSTENNTFEATIEKLRTLENGQAFLETPGGRNLDAGACWNFALSGLNNRIVDPSPNFSCFVIRNTPINQKMEEIRENFFDLEIELEDAVEKVLRNCAEENNLQPYIANSSNAPFYICIYWDPEEKTPNAIHYWIEIMDRNDRYCAESMPRKPIRIYRIPNNEDKHIDLPDPRYLITRVGLTSLNAEQQNLITQIVFSKETSIVDLINSWP